VPRLGESPLAMVNYSRLARLRAPPVSVSGACGGIRRLWWHPAPGLAPGLARDPARGLVWTGARSGARFGLDWRAIRRALMLARVDAGAPGAHQFNLAPVNLIRKWREGGAHI
jgi:hypothetical protein